MSATVTARGTGTHNSSATTFTLSPSGSLAAGSMAVLVVSADNAETNGVAFTTFKVTDDQGNLWTRRASPLYDPGAANAGVEGAQFTTDMAGGTILSSTVITVTFDTATTAKAWAMWEVVPDTVTTKAIVFISSGVNAGASTGTPTVTTSSITSGDIVIGVGHAENTDSWTQDGDSSNGSWSAHQHTGVGAGAAAISITSQSKVVTGTATQTYNPTRTASNCILSWIQLRQVPFLQVGAVDQTAFVLLESMSLRFNTFDFSLKNPATIPANGDAVTVGGPPYWTGNVVSVETIDWTNANKRVNVTATNTNVGVASQAPFGLSDAPDNSTTFMFRDMSVRVQTNIDDATQTTTGSCTTTQAGLWPAMTFALTSANRGYSGTSFSVTDVTVTWPIMSAPLFRVSFGDPIVTMSVWVASQAGNAPLGSIDGTRITDASITTPKFAANSIETYLLNAALIIDGTLQFTGGTVIEGFASPLTKVTNASTNAWIQEGTSGQVNYLGLRLAGDTSTRLALNVDDISSFPTGIAFGDGALAGESIYISRAAVNVLKISDSTTGKILLRYGHTSFPASPTTNDLFYRTDLGGWYFYNGTRWLSETLFTIPILNETVYPATGTYTARGFLSTLTGASDLWCVDAITNFFVVGGTALDGSNKWVGVSAAPSFTVTINSGALSTWRTTTNTIGALNGANISAGITWTKTGTPGNLYAYTIITYRKVAT